MDTPLIDQNYQRWLLTLSAPLVALNQEQGAAYDCPKFYPFDTTVDLTESWGVDNREELIAMVVRMTDDGHAPHLAGYYHMWHRFSHREWQDYVAQRTGREQVWLNLVAETAAICGEGGIQAWDLARVSFLCRIGLLNRWINEEENLWFHTQFASRARHYYGDWESYYNAFLIGRAYWLTQDNDTPETLNFALSQCSGTAASMEYASELYLTRNPTFKRLPWQIEIIEIERPESLQGVNL
ncbi:hypothetical protein B4914_16110 [Yersinia entomophaga]|nr:hypothetical protein B4914_16110 [Yersinia entomophaga]